MNPLIGQLLADAAAWDKREVWAEAHLQLGLLLELHNRPSDWDAYEEYLPLALRVVDFSQADQLDVVGALERLALEAPTEGARNSLLSALGSALPSIAMEQALRLLMDPPGGFTDGETRERVLFVVDRLLDFVRLPLDDPRIAALDGVELIFERFAPEATLEGIAADGTQLESERAMSILHKSTQWRGGAWVERIPTYAGGKPLEELLAGIHDVDPVKRRRALAVLTRLLVEEEAGTEESNEPVDERYRHLTLNYWAQRYVAKELERALLDDVGVSDRIAVLGALRRANPNVALSLLFWILADDVATSWDADEVLALLDALDEQLRKVATLHDDDADWGVRNGAEMALASLNSMSLSEAAPVREKAESVLDALRTFQHLPNGAQNRD